MTKTAIPFDSAAVTEAEWQKVFRHFLPNGVIVGWRDELLVTADGSAMQVTVSSGAAHLVGFGFDSDAAEVLPIDAADATFSRLDRIVVRLDRASDTIDFAVSKGTPAASPALPALDTSDTGFEVHLATVTVPAAAGVITAGNVSVSGSRFAKYDHGSHVTGLGDNDHPQYLLATAKAADSNLLDGKNTSTSTVADTIPIRTASGDLPVPLVPGGPSSAASAQYVIDNFVSNSGTAANSELLDGKNTSSAATPDTIPVRLGAGDITVPLVPGGPSYAASAQYVIDAVDDMAKSAGGTYTGNGGASRTISLPFDPRMVVVTATGRFGQSGAAAGALGPYYDGATSTMKASAIAAARPDLASAGFGVAHAGGAAYSLNESGVTYTYVAFG